MGCMENCHLFPICLRMDEKFKNVEIEEKHEIFL